MEDALGKEPRVLGEQTEQDLVQEVRDLVGIVAAGAQALGDLGDALGRLFRDLLGLDAWAELLRRDEHVAQGRQGVRWVVGGEVVQGDGDERRREAREVRADLDPLDVADDEQGRVAQVVLVGEQLDVGGLQVLVLALVLP